MSNSFIAIKGESEQNVNRSCTIAALWVAAVCALICVIGLLGFFGIAHEWMYFYVFAIILPILIVVAYARMRDYQASKIKYLMIAVSALVPASIAVPTLLGFFLMPLPIVVAGRYFSQRLVWKAYFLTLLLAFVMTIPHAYFGVPCYPLCEESKAGLQLFLDGQFQSCRYWKYLVVHCYPSFALCLSFFTITMSRLCKDHLVLLEQQAKINARLADVEKGLAIAATMEIVGDGNLAGVERLVEPSSQPDVTNWSTQAISDCIAKVKRRAAEDAEFAALVERDPAAAVREVQT